MRRFASFVLSAVCTLLLSIVVARAEAPVPAAYESAVDRAFSAFEAGQYELAHERFLEAYGVFPNARVLRALGKTEYELKRYGEAIGHLEQALASSVRPLSAGQRADVEQLLGQARARVARYTILTVPQETALLVNGAEPRRAADGALLLDPGKHVLELRATGYQTERRTLEVAGGSSEIVQIELFKIAPIASHEPIVEAPGPVSPPLESPEPPPASPKRKRRIWAGVASAVVAVAAGVTVGVVLARREPETALPSGGSTGYRGFVSPPKP